MSASYNTSTYAQLVDDLREEVNDERLSALADEQIQNWINRAQERVSDLVPIKDEYILGLNTGVSRYNFQDRPVITGATNVSPIVVTATAHGLSNTNRVTVRGVTGNTAANGRYQVASVATNSFALWYFADISDAVAGTDTVTVTTVQAHGWSTGDSVTIAGVTDMTDLNSTFSVTVVDATSFTVSLTTTQTYDRTTGAGYAIKATTGNAAYVSGGRFWRDDEIPTFFKDFKTGQRLWGTSYYPEIEMRDSEFVIYQQDIDTEIQKMYTDYGSPKIAGIGTENGIRYLVTYPVATYDQEVRWFGRVRVTARTYDNDSLSASIILSGEYEFAIMPFVKMKMYEWLKKAQERSDANTEFNGAINQLRMSTAKHMRVKVVYS